MASTTNNAARVPNADPATWQMALAALAAAGNDVEQAFDAREFAMGLPAPDLEALRWKLAQVFQPDECEPDYTPSWRRDYLAQTFADIDNLLAPPGGRPAATPPVARARDSARRPEAPSTWEAATSRYAAALGALHDGDQADLASRVNACEAAMWRLFEAPSPDLAAFARKLEIAFAPETDLSGMLDKEAAAALMLQDLQRLVGS